MRESRTSLVILLSWALAMASCGGSDSVGAGPGASEQTTEPRPGDAATVAAPRPESGSPASASRPSGVSRDEPVDISLVAQAFEEHRPAVETGRIRWRAAYMVKSSHSDFGGYSGLLIEGDRWLALSDRGTWWSADLRHDADGTLVGFDDSHIGELVDVDGDQVAGRDRFDAEELTHCVNAFKGSSPELIVSFEGYHRLHRYPRDGESLSSALTRLPRVLAAPERFATIDDNDGMEAVACIEGERLVVFAESEQDAAGNLLLWVQRDGGGWHQRLLAPTRSVNGDFQPTSATVLPSGELLLVERTWSPLIGVRIRLSLIDVADLLADDPRPVRSEELARFATPMPIDNMEAVDVRLGPKGETLIYLLADDNFNLVQRTILLQLELVE